jgi:type VI secretion system protein ImpA
LERLAEPQVKVVYDERNRPASQERTPGDWAGVLAKAEELREDGRDLRLLVLVTRALANEYALAGLAQGLNLIARTFGAYWDTMHPALRANAAPRDAALRRINALLDLQNGQIGTLADLRAMTWFAPRGVGPISGRDIEQGALDERVMLLEAASGLNATEKAALVGAHEQLLSRVRSGCAAQLDQAPDAMTQLVSDTRAAVAALDSVEMALTARLEGGSAAIPDLKRFLERALSSLERGTAARSEVKKAAGLHETQPEIAQPLANGHDNSAAAAVSHGGSSMALPDRISSRDDVVKCLDLVVSFYDRTEPSSPIPHLARRVRRMVHMDFVELMEDLAPSGLKEFRLLAGDPETKKTAQ